YHPGPAGLAEGTAPGRPRRGPPLRSARVRRYAAPEFDQPHVGLGDRSVVAEDVARDSDPGHEVDDLVRRTCPEADPILPPAALRIDAGNARDLHAPGGFHVPLVPLVGTVPGEHRGSPGVEPSSPGELVACNSGAGVPGIRQSDLLARHAVSTYPRNVSAYRVIVVARNPKDEDRPTPPIA